MHEKRVPTRKLSGTCDDIFCPISGAHFSNTFVIEVIASPNCNSPKGALGLEQLYTTPCWCCVMNTVQLPRSVLCFHSGNRDFDQYCEQRQQRYVDFHDTRRNSSVDSMFELKVWRCGEPELLLPEKNSTKDDMQLRLCTDSIIRSYPDETIFTHSATWIDLLKYTTLGGNGSKSYPEWSSTRGSKQYDRCWLLRSRYQIRFWFDRALPLRSSDANI